MVRKPQLKITFQCYKILHIQVFILNSTRKFRKYGDIERALKNKKYLLGLISTLLLIGCGQSDPVTPQAGKPNKETKESKDSKEPPSAPKHYME